MSFAQVHAARIVGSLSAFDRLIFKGHLTSLFPAGAFERLLRAEGILLEDFGGYVERVTQRIKAHLEALADRAGRPVVYLGSASTKRSGRSKDDIARAIAEQDGITEGLVCVLSTLETCWSFEVRGNHRTHRREVVRRKRKCLHYYVYLIDEEFGWMHVRLQSWFPFTIQVWVNGREWLARELDQEGIGYTRYLNSFQDIEDLERAQQLADGQARRRLVGVLHYFAGLVNPWADRLAALGFGRYYWVIDQAEYATDIIFRTRADLDAVLPDLLAAGLRFSPGDVLRFLGRKLHPNIAADITTHRARRHLGVRLKHAFKRNSLKVYDKGRLLRIETTINNPREFRVLRVVESERRWMPMAKGVANLWRYAQVAAGANNRYLDALANAPLHGEAVRQLDRLCRPRTHRGKRHARFEPLRRSDLRLFEAVLAGDHLIDGFRNRHIAALLFERPPRTRREQNSRAAKVSRLIAKLRAHGLIAKVKDARKYRVTATGHRVLGTVLAFYHDYFPEALTAA